MTSSITLPKTFPQLESRPSIPHEEYSLSKSLSKIGYIPVKQLANTLQGQVLLCKKNAASPKCLNKRKKNMAVLKITSRKLHKKGITLTKSNKAVRVKENIVKEVTIMRYLQTKNAPKNHINVLGFFKDAKNYILSTEYGGLDFFDYIKKNTDYVEKGVIKPKIWIKVVRDYFKQMCLYIKWLHNNNVCHLDISLENCLIQNNLIHFCDFGLSEFFNNNDFNCNKFCGKSGYMCPEIYNKTEFDARKADIWSLGMCLWRMLTGVPIYKKPDINKDKGYKCLEKGLIKELSIMWELNNVINDDICDLLLKIFTNESKRISIDEILEHKFMIDINEKNV